ncbi:Succinate dehydrogenase assembly factor 1 [Cladobotryum mycophilum]|uniref:Succinate dehydrogenase assembly factor 1 n=1 Tax=Cladobotryum mycophilum TaxID=491253 RepID=A0ABR0S702_9HYPO
MEYQGLAQHHPYYLDIGPGFRIWADSTTLEVANWRNIFHHYHASFSTSNLQLHMRLSGLQKEVLALYRQCLRESRKKPQSTRPHFEKFARSEFVKHISIDKRDFAAVEFLLRKGRRQLEVYSSPGIKDIR